MLKANLKIRVKHLAFEVKQDSQNNTKQDKRKIFITFLLKGFLVVSEKYHIYFSASYTGRGLRSRWTLAIVMYAFILRVYTNCDD